MAVYRKTGKITPVDSLHATDMRFGIGMEKLDRDVFDPSKAYDQVSGLGVKRVRLQSGWMRTEKEKGKYDFAWLDEVVDNLIKRGIEPWLCMCYGNPLYTERAKEVFGAVGCPPVETEEEKEAWANYCFATARHFAGRVREYEVWNEPDGQHCWKRGVNGEEYGNFVIATAKAIKSADKNALILAGSVCHRNTLEWDEAAFETGMGDYVDKFTFHDYCEHERRTEETAKILRAVINKYNPNIKLVMGETGCPSDAEGYGALHRGNWTENRQARLLVRRMVEELKNEVDFISWFTAVDMIEALHGVSGDKNSYMDYGYFGVLRAEFDENGFSSGEYSKKPSYTALSTVVSLFQHAKKEYVPVLVHWKTYADKLYDFSDEYADLRIATFAKDNGGKAFVYWKSTNVLTTEYEGLTELVVDMPYDEVKLVDILTGDVYEIPAEYIEDKGHGVHRFIKIPVKDYPLALVFNGFEKNE